MTAKSDLIDAARCGDQSALEKLIVLSQPDLKRFARRVCVTSEDAEDAVQIALWKMYRRIGTLRSISALATWSFRIVERECFRLFRRFRRDEPLDDALVASLIQAPIPFELRHDLSNAIAALPKPYREVLILRDVDELSAPEVAALLDISIPAVKSRLHRARSMVRKKLQNGHYRVGVEDT